GDRAFAVVDDETGRVASAKHPRLWGALLGYRARFVEPLADAQRHAPVEITAPDGTTARSDGDAQRLLSAALGRAVRLSATPGPQAKYDQAEPGLDTARGEALAVGAGAGTFFDFAPVHLVSTASLARLREVQPASDFAVARFRPNLVIDTGAAQGFVENDWLGQVLSIGAQVQLCVTFPCPRCVMTTLAQGPLAADPGVLRAAAEHNMRMFALLARRMPTVGVYATVVRGGTIASGDAVRLEGHAPLRRLAAVAGAVKRAVRRR
ncbi:MAG TPA: MOSC domain-containing protein, partial [Nannocystis sp.]